MSAEAPQTATPTFFQVAVEMLEPGSVVPCELWLRHGAGSDPLPYRSGNLPFTAEHRDRLRASGVATVLVPFSDSGTWARYLEGRLAERLADVSVDVAQRAEILVSTSTAIMKDVLVDPAAPGTAQRVGTIADAVAGFLRTRPAVTATVKLMRHDYYTYTHSLHVAVYAVALAQAAGIDAHDALAAIGRGGLMHDCGKCRLPHAVLNKNGPLSRDEWELMKQHPEHGRAILGETGWRDPLVEEVVHAHHERLNGSGYPRGLVGRSIPEAARIAAICDAYDAMTTDRSYHRARRPVDALRVIRGEDRDKYDLRLVDLFIGVVADR